MTVAVSAQQIRTKPLDLFKEAKSAVDLTQASLIVAIGRGIKAPENIPQAVALAKALGGEIAASRPICDEGWLPMERQIGSSGQTVAPKLYLALGISGAIQHVVGMKGARTIVAVNKDSNAPIFEIADYGVVGDIFEIMPALTEALEKAKPPSLIPFGSRSLCYNESKSMTVQREQLEADVLIVGAGRQGLLARCILRI